LGDRSEAGRPAFFDYTIPKEAGHMPEEIENMTNYISTAEAAELADYTPGYVRRLAREGKIRARKVTPRAWIVHKGDVLEHKRTVEPGRPREREEA
jgi:excisionase family DNA binding protein